MSKVKTISNLNELGVALRISEGFLVTVTLKEGDGLQHFMLMKNFAHLDMLKSLKESRELVIRHLENLTLADDTIVVDGEEEKIQEVEILEDKPGEDDVKNP